MSINGHNALLTSIDDLIYCALLSKIHKAYQFLLSLFAELGLDISQKKLHPPDTKVTCLALALSLIQKNRTMSICPEKLSEIIARYSN